MVFFGCGGFFFGAAWWMRTHEFWATASDREGYERHPTQLRRLNYLFSRWLNRVAIPIVLVSLGVASIASGIASLS